MSELYLFDSHIGFFYTFHYPFQFQSTANYRKGCFAFPTNRSPRKVTAILIIPDVLVFESNLKILLNIIMPNSTKSSIIAFLFKWILIIYLARLNVNMAV